LEGIFEGEKVMNVKKNPLVEYTYYIANRDGTIKTLENPQQPYKAGQYIMTGTVGENWPVKPDRFDSTYVKKEQHEEIVNGETVTVGVANPKQERNKETGELLIRKAIFVSDLPEEFREGELLVDWNDEHYVQLHFDENNVIIRVKENDFLIIRKDIFLTSYIHEDNYLINADGSKGKMVDLSEVTSGGRRRRLTKKRRAKRTMRKGGKSHRRRRSKKSIRR